MERKGMERKGMEQYGEGRYEERLEDKTRQGKGSKDRTHGSITTMRAYV